MNPRTFVTLIALVSADGYISTGQGVPWDLPRDKEHFRAATQGHWLLVGRRTYGEMLGWFGDHHPLVLTRDRNYRAPIGEAVSSVEEALEKVLQAGGLELLVLGGGPTFAAAMPHADRLLLTHVDSLLGGGVPFPAVLPDVWQEVSRQHYPADADNVFRMDIVTYERGSRHPGKPV